MNSVYELFFKCLEVSARFVEIISVAILLHLKGVNVFCLYILYFLQDWVKFGMRNIQVLLFDICDFGKIWQGKFFLWIEGKFYLNVYTFCSNWIIFVSGNGQRYLLSHCRFHVYRFSESRNLFRSYMIVFFIFST
jgi:hypothetical protein